MPDISAEVTQKSLDWLDRIQNKKGLKSRGEALDFLINQQLKRRGEKWLKERVHPPAATKPPTKKRSKSSSKKTTTPKKTEGPKTQSANSTSETPIERGTP